MITVKLKLDKTHIEFYEHQKQWNSVVRFAYQRLKECKNKTQVIHLVHQQMKNIDLLDYSWIESAILEAQQILATGNLHVIFGSKANFWKRKFLKITRIEYRKNRLIPIKMIGQKDCCCGNRKFQLDIIENQAIIYKHNKNTHFHLKVLISPQRKRLLSRLQQMAEDHKLPLTISVDKEYVYVVYDENYLSQKRHAFKKNRILSLDTNPNYLGIAVIDWSGEDDKSIIHKMVISNKELNKLYHKGVANDHSSRVYCKNKRAYETAEIAKYLINLAKYYHCEIVAFEDLNIKSKNHKKGKRYNRLVNNLWNRKQLYQFIIKRCVLNDIRYQEVPTPYSSFIGCIQNPSDTDSIAAAIEICRRAYLFNKVYVNKESKKVPIIYPKYDSYALPTRWKEMAILNGVKGWKQLYELIKKMKLSYRLLWDEFVKNKQVRSFSLNHNKMSKVVCYVC